MHVDGLFGESSSPGPWGTPAWTSNGSI